MAFITWAKKQSLSTVLYMAVLACGGLSAMYPLNQVEASATERAFAFAKEMEQHFWKAVQNKDIEKFSDKLSHEFQGLNIDGIYDREEQIEGLTQADLISFKMSRIKVTFTPHAYVITYQFDSTGTGLTNGATMSVWARQHYHVDPKLNWKMISHSYVPNNG